MEEINTFAIEKRQTVKDQYINAYGKEISLDYFLFTCFEEEHTYQAMKVERRKLFDKLRHPSMLQASSQEELQGRSFTEVFDELFAWYVQEYAVMSGSKTLDYQVHGELLSPFMAMVRDVEQLVQVKLGKTLQEAAIQESTNVAEATAATEGEQQVSQEQEALVLELLEAGLKKYFANYSSKMFSYFQWITKDAKQVSYNLATLPPVGRFAAILQRFKRKIEQAKGLGFRNKRDAGRGHSGPKGSFKGRHGTGPSRRPGRSSEPASRGPRSGQQGAKNDREKAAMNDIEQCVKKLKKVKHLKEMLLKPQNSFIRRQQHKKIKSLGFYSESVGEGAQRAVKILRKKP